MILYVGLARSLTIVLTCTNYYGTSDVCSATLAPVHHQRTLLMNTVYPFCLMLLSFNDILVASSLPKARVRILSIPYTPAPSRSFDSEDTVLRRMQSYSSQISYVCTVEPFCVLCLECFCVLSKGKGDNTTGT